MKTIDSYETIDGVKFDSLDAARNHERAVHLATHLEITSDLAEFIVSNRDSIEAVFKWRGRVGTNPWTPRRSRKSKAADVEGRDGGAEIDDADIETDAESDDVNVAVAAE